MTVTQHPAARIREAVLGDLVSVAAIYKHWVTHSTVTFDTEAKVFADWVSTLKRVRARGLPFLVLEHGGSVVGYAYVSEFRAKTGWRPTVENSVYVAPDHLGRGHGRRLLDALIGATRASADVSGARNIMAVIVHEGAEASLQLHREFGFVQVAELADVGYKFDRFHSVVMMQLDLTAEATISHAASTSAGSE